MEENPTSRRVSVSSVLLVDGHSLAFRAYYAFAKSREGGLRTSTGLPTSVCFGFLRSLLDSIATHRPSAVAIAFDTSTPTFRHDADANYKAQRAETPEDFIPDVEHLKQLLAALNLQIFIAPGYEADDILGTLAQQASRQQYKVQLLSGDQDLFQLICDDPPITVLHLAGGWGRKNARPQEFQAQQVQDKLGIRPQQVVDYKALCGDSSDNLPGVKGIGPKTAVKLLEEYGSLDEIYNHLEEIKGATRKKLETGREAAYHTQYMAEINCEVPLQFNLDDLTLRGFDAQRLLPLLDRLELHSLRDRLNTLQDQLGGGATETTSPQPTASGSPAHSAELDDTGFWSWEDTQASQPPEESRLRPLIVDSPETLQTLIKRLQDQTNPHAPVAWDTETTSTKATEADLVGLGCCWGESPEDLAYIPLAHRQGNALSLEQVLEALRPILQGDRYPKVFQNTKYDRLVLRSHGILLQGVVFDTLLASYLLNPETTHNLTDLALRHLDLTVSSFKDIVPKGKTIADVSIPVAAHYCAEDVHVTYRLVPLLREQLRQTPQLETLLNTVELPLEAVLAEMEFLGIRLDIEYLKTLSDQLAEQLDELEKTAYELAGDSFNLNSPKQLGEILFDRLGLDKRKTRQTKTGNYSTNAKVLDKLHGDHPIIDVILEHRTLAKLKSTYVDALPELVRVDEQQANRIHTDFNQTITATGRLSSSNPNLQNIPIRTEFSRRIRKAFLPREGWRLVTADYSQIELRILAHLSQEPILLEAYDTGQDVHRLTAQLLFEKEEISSEERRLGKTINFGVIYGMGAQRFAREAGVSSLEGREFIDRYNTRYSRVFAYLQQMKREAIARGYVETLCGRRRYFTFESSALRKLQGQPAESIDLENLKNISLGDSQALRAAANAPIQGSSADIIKIAMVKLHQLLGDRAARILLQVHDELVFEMPAQEWPQLEFPIRDTMESALKLSIPLVVDIHQGENWMEAK
ncbi:DNA polymerase I [Sodalinema sp.]|uniref:DNA polymerase I n=1 Tax=Sodalinema sp. TaxID=3080550 RepID=UPI0012258E37|nr:MAG: DNA polymerase I [Phormidium sp. SL48-SHIP]